MFERQITRFAQPLALFTSAVIYEVFCLDDSGSMEEIGFEKGRKKLDTVLDALIEYLAVKLDKRPQDRIALVAYSGQATILCPFLCVGTQFALLVDAVHGMIDLPHGSTELGKALYQALDLFDNAECHEAELIDGLVEGIGKRCLVYSDGHDGDQARALQLAHQLKQQGVMIETLGIAKTRTEVAEDFLQQVATTDHNGTHYRFLGDPTSVYDTFSQLAQAELVVEE